MFDDRVTIIAEIGSNHDGDMEKAFEMIDVAANCGADIVKFQGFLADDMVAKDTPDYALLKQLEVPKDWYPKLMERCEDNHVRFLSTATNFTTMDWMEELGVWGYKVASCNVSYTAIIDRLIKIGKPVLVSTGLATKEEIKELSDRFSGNGIDHGFFHCVSKYPVEAKDIRLGNIQELMSLLPCPVGFSDHSEGDHLAVAAVALGAQMVEKHITLTGEGVSPDHGFAMKPDDFRRMCRAIRETESGLFSDFSLDEETAYRMRRALHFTRDIKAGTIVTESDLKVTRPEDGLLPKHLSEVVGRKLAWNVKQDEPVDWICLGKT